MNPIDKTLKDQANKKRCLGQKNPNKPEELPSPPDNLKHTVNALELIPSETEIAKVGVLNSARIAWSEKLNVFERSISAQTALPGIIFLNENYTIECVI